MSKTAEKRSFFTDTVEEDILDAVRATDGEDESLGLVVQE